MEDHKGMILDLDSFSTHDGPGIRMTVFLKGCPLRCRWCHSPETQDFRTQLLYKVMKCRFCFHCIDSCPCHAISQEGGGIVIARGSCVICGRCEEVCVTKALQTGGKVFSPQQIAELAEKDKKFYNNSGGGVTVSGGEPLMQPGFTKELLRLLNRSGISAIIETCGYGSRQDLEECLSLCDSVFYDIKIMDSEKHLEYTGKDNKMILENLEYVCRKEEYAEKITVRTPCIPGINDSEEEIRSIAAFASKCGVNSMELMPYNVMAPEKYTWIGREYPLVDCKLQPAGLYESLNHIIDEFDWKGRKINDRERNPG